MSAHSPPVCRVDVPAVLVDNDQPTNVPVKPSDVVCVGETTRSVIARMIPNWMEPLYRRVLGLLPEEWRPWVLPTP